MASTLSAPNPIKDIYKKLVFYDVAHGSNAFEFQYTNASTLEDVPITDIKNDFIFHKQLTLLSTIQNSDSYVGSYTQSALNNNPINVAQLHSDIYGDDYNQTEVPDYLPKHRYEETWTLTNASLMEVDLEERNQRYDKDIQQDYEFDKLQLLVAGTTWTESQYEADEENPYNPYTTADPTVLRPTSSFIANSTPSNLGDAAATNLIEADTILDKEIEHNRTWLETAWNYINGTDGGSAPAHPGGAVAGEPSLFDGTLWTADGYYINDASNDPNPTRPGGAAGPAITTNMFNAIQNLDTESRENEEWLNAINKWIDSSDVDNTDQTLSWASPADNWSEFSVLTTGTYTANPVNAAVSGDMVDALTHMDMNIRLLKYQIDKNKDNTTAVIDDDGGTDWVQNTLRRSLTELRDDFDALKTTMDGSGNTTGGGFTYASTVGDTYANQDTLHGDISEIDAQLEAATTMITGATTAGAQYSTDVDGVENSVESDIERLHDLSISDTWSHKNRLDQIVNSSTGKLVNASADVLDMASKRITNLANPSATFDAATKSWVETQVAGAVQGHGVQVCTFRLGDSANVPGTDLAPGGGIMAVDCSSAQNWALAGDTSAESLENSGAGADYNHGGITLDGTGYAPKSTMASGCYIDGHLMVEGDLVILTEEGATTCDGVTADEANNHWGSAHDSDVDDWHWRNGVWKFNYSGTNSGVWERPSAGDALWEDGNALAQGLIHAVEFGKDEGDNDVVWAFWTIQPELTYTYGENCIIASNYTDAKATFDLGDGKSPRNAWSVFTALQAFNEGNVTTIEDANTVQVTLDSESLTAVGATGSPLSGGTLTANLDGVMTKTGSGINLNFDALDFVDDGGVLKLLTTRADTMTSTNIGSNTLVANLASYEGLVGIGTATPASLLHIESTGSAALQIETSGTVDRAWKLFASGIDGNFYVRDETGTNTMMAFDVDGNIGIGTDAPTSRLDIEHESLLSSSTLDDAIAAGLTLNGGAGVQSGEYFPAISWYSDDGELDSTEHRVGAITCRAAEHFDGANNAGVDMQFFVHKDSTDSDGPELAMTIQDDGFVGIGTDNPEMNIEISHSNATPITGGNIGSNLCAGLNIVHVPDTDGGGSVIKMGSNNDNSQVAIAQIQVDATNSEMAFYTDTSGTLKEAIRIDDEQNVGIGTDAPLSILEIQAANPVLTLRPTSNNSDYSSTIRFQDTNSDNFVGGYIQYDSDANNLVLGVHNTTDKLVASDVECIVLSRADGKVGIGTDDPGEELEIAGVSKYTELGITTHSESDGHTGGLIFRKSAGTDLAAPSATVDLEDLGKIDFYGVSDADEFKIAASILCEQDDESLATMSGRLTFKVRDADTNVNAMTILKDGKVGIGTTEPRAKLEVVDGVIDGTTYVIIDNTSTNQFIKLGVNASEAQIMYDNLDTFRIGEATTSAETSVTTSRLLIATDGVVTVTAGTVTSDERLKENISDIVNPLTVINSLTGRTFEWIDDNMPLGTQYGVIAQELESVVPELVHNDGLIDIDGSPCKSANITGVIPILIEAIKELSAKVTALENA